MTRNVPAALLAISSSPCKDDAWMFFAYFSRFEYALKKKTRYLSNSVKVMPDWGEFAKFCDSNKESVIQLQKSEAWDYLFQFPPKKQILVEGGWGWSEPIWKKSDEPSFKWVCDCLNIVRNNFFHGGKFPMAPTLDPSRNCEILSHGISLLEFLAKQDPDVYQFVYDADLGD